MFSDKKSSVETFKYFRYSHLDYFFKETEIGERIPFEHHLFKWQRENNFFEEPYKTADTSNQPSLECPQLNDVNEFLIIKSTNTDKVVRIIF